jgi:hypothetical protein
MPTVNWDEVRDSLETEIRLLLDEMVDGAEGDLQEYGRVIASDMLHALQANDAMRRELLHQAEALAEIHRIRAVGVQWRIIGAGLGAIFNTAFHVLAIAGWSEA